MRKLFHLFVIGLMILALGSAKVAAQLAPPHDLSTSNFFEGFEDDAINYEEITKYVQEAGDPQSGFWKFSALYGSAHTGTFAAALGGINGNMWFFIPVTLTANQYHNFQMKFRSNSSSPNTYMKVMMGSDASIASMTTTIIPETAGIKQTVVELKGAFRVETAGTYYIGIMGKSAGVDISIDDISMYETDEYIPVIDESLANGSVSVDNNDPLIGDTIKITAIPAENYVLAQYKVTTTSGDNVEVNSNGEFIMPNFGVTVSAIFLPVHNLNDANLTENFNSYADFETIAGIWAQETSKKGSLMQAFDRGGYVNFRGNVWIYTPIYVTKDSTYLLEFNTYHLGLPNSTVSAMIGQGLAYSQNMTDTFIKLQTVPSSNTRLFRSFTATTTGIYMFGINIDVVSTGIGGRYVIIDNIVLKK